MQILEAAGVTPEQLDQLQKLLPEKVDNIRLIVDLNAVAARNQSSLRNIRVVSDEQPASAGAPAAANQKVYGTLSVSFSVSMTYKQYLDFMKDIEENLRLMDVSSMSFTPSETGTYDFAITLKTYWLR
jgi:Tfp pilus assembly protein PilO